MNGTGLKIKSSIGAGHWRWRVIARCADRLATGLDGAARNEIVTAERFKAGILEEYLAGVEPDVLNAR
jgi:hypothetical protein